ncbi:DUF3667 domain-containing protein [Tenacibaculum sp. nBUS_03]|uniref:DUF3667 domain-containing protein n=1 Tax=Tenacibaculum sp. nBUS_03 TaxID=3395320 RepID=UPI003EBC2410
MNCISCNHEHDENFCPNCGEKKNVEKITFKSMFNYAFLSAVNMDKGFLFNVKMLIINPKKVILDYIKGKRKGVLNPISFLIISVSIYLIVEGVFRVPKTINEVGLNEVFFRKVGNAGGRFIREYLKFFWIFSIFPLSFFTKLVFRKYNYSEHLAISSFVVGEATLFGLLSYIVFKTPLLFDPVVYFIIVILLYRFFIGKNNKFEVGTLSLISVFLFFFTLFLSTILIGFVKVKYSFI